MNPVILQLVPAPANLVGAAVDGTSVGVFVEASQYRAPPGPWKWIWDDASKSIFVRARHGQAGLIIEVRVEDNRPPVAAAPEEADDEPPIAA